MPLAIQGETGVETPFESIRREDQLTGRAVRRVSAAHFFLIVLVLFDHLPHDGTGFEPKRGAACFR